MPSGAIVYTVHPRYTPGSPAAVDADTAQRVALDERKAYQEIVAGRWFDDRMQALAREKGLANIVICMEVLQRSLRCYDMLTQERYTLHRNSDGTQRREEELRG